jgi:hypothetical protein
MCGIEIQPPWDPKTLVIRLDQRREIRAWRRNREVASCHPQSLPVSAPLPSSKPLFFQGFSNLLKFSGNI